MSKTRELLDIIGSMKVIELAEFIKELETEFGVSAASMAVAAPVAAAGAGEAAAPEEAKSEYKVELLEAGGEKIKTIKAIRSISIGGATMALTEAKEKVEGAPVVLFEAIPKEDAEKLKKALEEAGAKVKLS